MKIYHILIHIDTIFFQEYIGVMKDEILLLVDKEGNPVGSAPRKQCHSDNSLIQLVVRLEIVNSRGEIYLQKRSHTKDMYPNLWDTAVGGHVRAGEEPFLALIREASEEIGIDARSAKFLTKVLFQSEKETELSFLYIMEYDGPFFIDNNEVVDGRFFSKNEIISRIGTGFFTPSFEIEFKLLKSNLR